MSNVYRIYCRVSTEDQKRGYSLGHQRDVLSKFKPDDYSLEVYVEAGSGKNIEGRPKLQKLLRDVSEGDIVAVYDVSRLGRSTEDNLLVAKEIISKRASLSVAGNKYDPESPSAELQLTIESAVGAFHRRVQNSKSRAGIELKKEKGEWIFSPRLYGYRHVQNHIEIIEEEANVIRFIFESYVKGDSVFKIRNELSKNGIRNRKGTEFSDTTLYRFLFNPIFAGYYYPENKNSSGSQKRFFNKPMVKSKYYEPIVSLELFNLSNKVHRSLRRTKSMQFQYRSKPYILTSILACGICGSRYIHTNKKYHDSVISNNRIVHKKECTCNVCTLNEEIFKDLYNKLFSLVFLYPNDLVEFLESEKQRIFESNNDIDIKISDCKEIIIQKGKEKKRLVDAIARIGLDQDIEASIKEITEDITNVERQILQLEQSKTIVDQNYLEFMLEDLRESELSIFNRSDDTERNLMFKKYFKSSKVFNDRIVVRTIYGVEFIIGIERKRHRRVYPTSIGIIRKNRNICLLDMNLDIIDINRDDFSIMKRNEIQRRINEIQNIVDSIF